MKNNLLLLAGLLICLSLHAQTGVPQGFNYQAVPRKFDGSLFDPGQTLKVRFFIRENNANGTVRFAEQQNLTVSPQGAVAAVVGAGGPVPNMPHTLQLVEWGSNTFFLGVSIDVNGNNTFEPYEDFGATQLMSVPYALFSQKTMEGTPGPQGPEGPAGPQGPPGPAGAGGIAGGGTVDYLPKFSTNGTTLGNSVIAEQNGRIGIGTTDLGINKLRVLGDARVDGYLRLADVSGQGGYSELYHSNNQLASTSNFRPTVNGQSLGTTTHRWNLNASDINLTGEIGFGTKTIEGGSGQSLSINANLFPAFDNGRSLGNSTYRWSQVWAANGTIQTSDARYKQDVEPLDYGLETLNKLRPVSYRWKEGHEGESRHLGFIAQELQEVLPEVVHDHEWVVTDENTGAGAWQPTTRLGVAYSEIIPVLVAAMQEQQTQIEALKTTNAALEARLKNLETNVSASK